MTNGEINEWREVVDLASEGVDGEEDALHVLLRLRRRRRHLLLLGDGHVVLRLRHGRGGDGDGDPGGSRRSPSRAPLAQPSPPLPVLRCLIETVDEMEQVDRNGIAWPWFDQSNERS
jgi:hypothetical protein